jgi:hypothetical protein
MKEYEETPKEIESDEPRIGDNEGRQSNMQLNTLSQGNVMMLLS